MRSQSNKITKEPLYYPVLSQRTDSVKLDKNSNLLTQICGDYIILWGSTNLEVSGVKTNGSKR